MSPGGRSELEALRQKIVRIGPEGCSGAPAASCGLRSLGRAEAPDHPGASLGVSLGVSLGASLDHALPGGLRRGALHEIAPGRPGDGAAACGFALALAARFVKAAPDGRADVVWIVEDAAARETGAPYGVGLALHGLDPARLVLVHARNARESLWSMEEALKGCAAVVIGEIWSLEKTYGLAASRRLALAAHKSGAPALMLAAGMAGRARLLSSSAQTRFEVFARAGPDAKPRPMARGLPPPGLACWAVRILKARAGQGRFSFDRDETLTILWDHEEACFRDAFPVPLSAHAGHRPDHATARKRSQTEVLDIA